jgi:hypothetical protein
MNRTCVGTYVEKDSKCDLATESRSMSDINRTLDTYVMRCSNIRNCDPPFELELYRASSELALKGGVTGHRSQLPKNATPNSPSHV